MSEIKAYISAVNGKHGIIIEVLTEEAWRKKCFKLLDDIRAEGFYVYGMRHDDSDWSEPITLEPYVMVNRFGWFITREDFGFNETFNCIDLDPDNFIGLGKIVDVEEWVKIRSSHNDNAIEYKKKMLNDFIDHKMVDELTASLTSNMKTQALLKFSTKSIMNTEEFVNLKYSIMNVMKRIKSEE